MTSRDTIQKHAKRSRDQFLDTSVIIQNKLEFNMLEFQTGVEELTASLLLFEKDLSIFGLGGIYESERTALCI